MIDLDDLQRKHEAATPGPWHREMIELGNGGPLTLGIGSKERPVCIVNGIVESPAGNRDVAVIIALRNAAPQLIAELKAARELAENAEAVCNHASVSNIEEHEVDELCAAFDKYEAARDGKGAP